jgi:hypothetical protein
LSNHYLNLSNNSSKKILPKNNTCNLPEPLYLYGLREINQTQNERTGHLHELGNISVQSNSYFTPRGLVYGVL